MSILNWKILIPFFSRSNTNQIWMLKYLEHEIITRYWFFSLFFCLYITEGPNFKWKLVLPCRIAKTMNSIEHFNESQSVYNRRTFGSKEKSQAKVREDITMVLNILIQFSAIFWSAVECVHEEPVWLTALCCSKINYSIYF